MYLIKGNYVSLAKSVVKKKNKIEWSINMLLWKKKVVVNSSKWKNK